MFLEKGLLKMCSKLTGQYPCRSAISTPFPKNTSGELLLYRQYTYKQFLGKTIESCSDASRTGVYKMKLSDQADTNVFCANYPQGIGK